MACSFGSLAAAVVIHFRSLYAPQNLNMEGLPERSRRVKRARRSISANKI